MLDGRKACVPGFEDSSGGHIHFKAGPYSLRVCGPGSNHFDEANTDRESSNTPSFDLEAWVDQLAKEIIFDLTTGDRTVLKAAIRNLLLQAQQHCESEHGDIRKRCENH